MEEVNKSLPSASGTKRRDLIAQRDRLQGQLSLNKAMLDAIQKLFGALSMVYEKYRAGIENQLGSIERRLEVQLKAPVPEAKLQFADAGLEFVVRYPVDIRRASEIDDQITRSVLQSLEEEQELKVAVLGSPKIRAAIKG